MDNRYPNSGALFPVRNKRSDKSPDMSGDITLDGDVLTAIYEAIKANKPAKIRLTGYNKASRNGGRFISVRAYAEDDQQSNQRGYNNQQNYYNDAPPIQERGGYQNYGPAGQRYDRPNDRPDDRRPMNDGPREGARDISKDEPWDDR